ncbi:MAG: DMT family transporter [Gemmatimonadales bacterium]
MRLVVLTALALVAFAANSLLCRMALGGERIDPVSFTTLRLVSGALVLAVLARRGTTREATRGPAGSWGSGVALFAYAMAFSLAYQTLSTGMGALILFGAVQVTMLGAALAAGEAMGTLQWVGSAAAAGGLVYLVLPGIAAPDPIGALLMGAAGVAWGVYSIRGRGVSRPVRGTAGNFLRSAPLTLVVSAAALSSARLSPSGILLALASGIVTSGLGYVLWYSALRSLTTTQAAVVQLLVPVLAAFGGVALLSERVSVRLVAASSLILGGVTLALWRRSPAPAATGRGMS